MNTVSALLSIAAAVATLVLLRALIWCALRKTSAAARALGPFVVATAPFKRSAALRLRFALRFPAISELIVARADPHRPTGLPLTLMAAAALYLAAMLSGLTEDILEAHGTVLLDDRINTLLATFRVQPLISIFGWITDLGSSEGVVSAAVIATGFLWAQQRGWMAVAMWLTCIGALASTTIGKFLIGRHRPPLDVADTIMTPSFPSGHATIALAIYGFLAYAITRGVPSPRKRFEIAYWTATLIVLIGFSRIFLGFHYVTDVIGGFLVGGFWLLVGFIFAESNLGRQTRPTANDCEKS